MTTRPGGAGRPPTPPALARWLVARRYRGEAREVIEGDLAELYHRALASGVTRRAATRLYWRLTLASMLTPRSEVKAEGAPSARTGHPAAGLQMFADARLAGRRLVRSPGFVLPAILTLGLAIGANAAVFGVLERLVLSPLPFADANRLVYLWRTNAERSMFLTASQESLDRWRQLDHVFEQIQAFESRTFVLTGAGDPEEISASAVPDGLFPMLGVAPTLGRSFTAADLVPASPPTVVLGESLWRRRFGADASVIGRAVRLGDESFQIIGVMPRGFRVPMGSGDLWVPLQRGRGRGANAIGRLREGVSVEAAQAAVTALGPVPSETGGAWSGVVMAPGDLLGTSIRQTVTMLTGAVALLLLLASANVANLVVSRNRTRRQELAVCAALGASRARLARLLLTETALVAIAGGALGLVIASAGLSIMQAWRPENLGVLDGVRLDGAVLWYTLAVTAGAGILVGVVPALRASRASLQSTLAGGGRAVIGGGHFMRGVVGATQIGAALVLVVGALLLTRSLANLTSISPGFDAENVVSLDLPLPATHYPGPEARERFFTDLLEQTRGQSGVQSAALSTGLPPATGIMFGSLEIEGAPQGPSEPIVLAGSSVSPGYFATLRIPLVAGQEFTAEDVTTRRLVTIVSETFARKFLPSGGALGSRVRLDSTSEFATVVGVAADVRANGLAESEMSSVHVYVPFRSSTSALLVVRTAGDPLLMVDALKARVWALDPNLAIREIVTARERLRQASATSRFGLVLLGLFAAIGLALAAVGVFGVLMLIVGQRRREMAVRLSLGATQAQVIGRVGRYAAWVTGLGLALGLSGAALLSRYISSLLTGVTPSDPATMIAAVATVVVAAALAAVGPARRLATVEPVEALRLE